ncbi:MAG: glutamine synthetase type III, partial [Clostridiales bacterium]|nr:glutamine synthetase type III [Clostridiales bacterium]
GYTAWDPTSYAFIKDGTLCIPTAFCSYSGEALDKKTPLLRSMEALDRQALRILRLFGNTDVIHTSTTVGAEQEYFLISKETYLKRPDLVYTGRTLFGARPPKGQELDDHYFGALKPRVKAFMREVDEELWKLGIPADTEHNETAPAQHELTPIFTTANIAADHNQLTMEVMRKVADKHGLVCLLHEKPFAGINGSGKHNNWSISTDTGVNLLEPGETPHDNAQFLLFLVAVIRAVDEYQDLLRISVASAGNDHRLGTNEAPPALISMFLGDELGEILAALEAGTDYRGREAIQMEIGVTALPHFPKDMTDRNRTSPFAFTGNKFEFRMLGAMSSIAEPNIVLNTAVAKALSDFADELEYAGDFFEGVAEIVRRTIRNHRRIIFNGNGYDAAWHKEAEELRLSNLVTTPDALRAYITEKNVDLFEKMNVYTRKELESRYEIFLENYSKTINIEALTMIDLVRHEIVPAVIDYQLELSELLRRKEMLGGMYKNDLESELLGRVSKLGTSLMERLAELETETVAVRSIEDSQELAGAYRERVFTAMNELRLVVDELELLTPSKHRSLPTYGEILYSVT